MLNWDIHHREMVGKHLSWNEGVVFQPFPVPWGTGAVAGVSYGSLDVKHHFHMPVALSIKHSLWISFEAN